MFFSMRALAEEQERAVGLLRKVRDDMSPRSPLRDSIDDVLNDLDQMNTVDELNTRFADWGEEWHVPISDLDGLDDDDYVTKEVGQALTGLNSRHIAGLRQRRRITGRWEPFIRKDGSPADSGRWLYRVADLRKLATDVRARGGKAWRATRAADNIPASGTGDSE